jgi:transcriptional regulator with XRE-family HTH domain
MREERRAFAKKLGEVLRAHRLEAGLRQADLAALLGENQTFVSKYELAERRLELFDLLRLCGVLALNPSDIIEEVSTTRGKRRVG